MSKYIFTRLKNGTRVILVPMEGVESTAVGVYVQTGSRYETPRINGISHFLEHMVFKGTKKFPTHTDTSYLEGLGAIQNAWTSMDATSYWCKIPADKWREGLELVKELAVHPLFPEKELEIERGVILEEINRREDRPDEISGEELMRLMYPSSSLGMTILGEPEVIKSVSRQDFVDYHALQYKPGRMVVAMAGKVDTDAAMKAIEEWFGELPAESGQDFTPFVDTQKSPAISFYKKDTAAQAHIELAVRGLTDADPRRFPLSLLTAYLGQGLSSRLFIEVREKRGLCYTIRASQERFSDTGVWSVYAGLNTDKLADAIKAILAEMKRVKHEKLTEDEVNQSKEKLRGRLLFSMEDPIEQMEYFAKQALDRPDEILTHQEVIDRLMQSNADMIRNVAVDLFTPEKLNLAIVGPVPETRKAELQALLEV